MNRISPKSLLRDETGIAAVEFALCLTVLLVMFLGSVELTRYILIIQKLEKTVSMMTDVITQTDPNSSPLTTATLQEVFTSATDMMKPYALGSLGYVIMSDITQAGTNNPVVNWQYCGGGTLAGATSKLGVKGGAATLPAGFTMNAGEEVVIGEIYYQFTPITTQNVVPSKTLYRTSIFMPRLGALTSFTSSCR